MKLAEWRKWLDGQGDFSSELKADILIIAAETRVRELEDALRVEREHYASLSVDAKALQAQVLRLRKAIEKHRGRDWSEKSPPYENWDEELYAALDSITESQEPIVRPAEANAFLMAAAPDLLISCKELRDVLAAAMRILAGSGMANSFIKIISDLGIPNGFGVRADAVIARAETKIE